MIEVMLAATVMVLGISGALVTLQRGLQSVNQARHLSAASHLMQTELELLRLKNWAQIEILQAEGDAELDVPPLPDGSRLTCIRRINDLRPGIKEIILDASWGGRDGQAHQARLVTRYSHSGLNDYFYTTR